MTTDRQIKANRANAHRSTGPQSEAGKTQVARNAVRHGATGRPTVFEVSKWFRVINNGFEYRRGSLMTNDDTTRLALRLADAEARLAAAEAALADLEAIDVHELEADLNTVSAAALLQAIANADPSKPTTPLEQSTLTVADIEALTLQLSAVERRRRLLKRYVREAQGQRKRAFRTWLAHLSGSAQTQRRD